MTMLRLGRARRALLAEAFRELANLTAAALVLGQLVRVDPLSLPLFLVGSVVWLVLLGAALLVAPENTNG